MRSRTTLRQTQHVEANEWSDDQWLPFDEAADGKQKNTTVQISTLQLEESGDQKRREIDVYIAERDAV